MGVVFVGRRLLPLALFIFVTVLQVSAQDSEDEDNTPGAKTKDADEQGITKQMQLGPLVAQMTDPLRYDKNTAPKKGMEVYVSYRLESILGIDAVAGKIHHNGYLFAVWIDERIKFYKSACAPFTIVMLHTTDMSKVWYPRLFFCDTVESNNPTGAQKVGLLPWDFITVTRKEAPYNMYYFDFNAFTTRLSVDLFHYPFDTVQAQFSLKLINLDAGDFSLRPHNRYKYKLPLGCSGDYKNAWQVDRFACSGGNTTKCVHVSVSKSCGKQGLCDSKVIMSVSMTRAWSAPFMGWVLPLQILWLLSYMTYWLDPAGTSGRYGMTITCFLSIIMFQLDIKPSIPLSSKPTWIEYYLMSYILMVGWSPICFLLISANFQDKDSPYEIAYRKYLEQTDEDSLLGVRKSIGDDGEEQSSLLANTLQSDDARANTFKLDIASRFFVLAGLVAVNVWSLVILNPWTNNHSH